MAPRSHLRMFKDGVGAAVSRLPIPVQSVSAVLYNTRTQAALLQPAGEDEAVKPSRPAGQLPIELLPMLHSFLHRSKLWSLGPFRMLHRILERLPVSLAEGCDHAPGILPPAGVGVMRGHGGPVWRIPWRKFGVAGLAAIDREIEERTLREA